jgi:hypothetical protein
MEPGTNFVALLRRWEDAGGVWRVLGHDRDNRARLGARLWQGLAQLCVSITRAERGNRIGALRLVGRVGDDWRLTPPPVSRYKQPTPARHSRICQTRNCPGRLQPVQTLRRHPTGVPPPVRPNIQYRANLAECLGFDSDLSETSGISNKSYGFEPCVR